MEHQLIELFVTPGKCKQLNELGLSRGYATDSIAIPNGPIYREFNFDGRLFPMLFTFWAEAENVTHYKTSVLDKVSYYDHFAWSVLDMLMLIPDWHIAKLDKVVTVASDSQYEVPANAGLFLPDVVANHVINYLIMGKLSVEECNKKFFINQNQ